MKSEFSLFTLPWQQSAAQSSSTRKICPELRGVDNIDKTSATVTLGYLSQEHSITGSLCPVSCLSNSVISQTNISAMTSEANEENKPDGMCLLGNWVEKVSFTQRV